MREMRSSLVLVVRPATIGCIVTLVWYELFFRFGWSIEEGDGPAFTDAGIPVLAMFHAIAAGAVLTKIWGGYQKVIRAIATQNKDAFLECVRDRIPGQIHVMMGALAVLSQFQAMLIPYEGALAGIVLNFVLAFVFSLYWEVATSLDDPLKAPWCRDRIPDDWKTLANMLYHMSGRV